MSDARQYAEALHRLRFPDHLCNNCSFLEDAQAVIKQAITAEREACAALAEQIGQHEHERAENPFCDASDFTGEAIAAAIRARTSAPAASASSESGPVAR